MYKRLLSTELEGLTKSYPVVTLVGPRQSGKTTLVKHVFKEKPYANLEAHDVRQFATADPRRFLAQYPDGAILDEIQQTPELLSYIQVLVDEDGRNGLFILTGSHQLELHHAIAQSLAGRTAILQLLPMSLAELAASGIHLTTDEALITGGYPRIYKERLKPRQAYQSYLQTYIERDLRQLIHVHDLVQFQRFMGLCAGRVGQILNYAGLANDVGVSANTIKHWISMLEASYIVFRLAPFFDNFGKRLIKSPKLYFNDVGLASYLLGIETPSQMARDPLRGNLFENLVALELVKARLNRGLDPRLFYYRDVKGHEIDLIFQSGRELIPIEVKAGMTFNSDYLKNLQYFKTLAKERCPHGYLVYDGELEQRVKDFEVINYRQLESMITRMR